MAKFISDQEMQKMSEAGTAVTVPQPTQKEPTGDILFDSIFRGGQSKTGHLIDVASKSSSSPTISDEEMAGMEAAETKKEAGEKKPGLIRSGLGLFMNPILESGVRFGQTAGAALLKGADVATRGAISKRTPEGDIDAALEKALGGGTTLPVTGGKVRPVGEITAKSEAGRALSTIGLGVGNIPLAGAMVGGGMALEEDKSLGEAGVQAVIGALTAKIFAVGIEKAAPFVSRAVAKYGTPIVEELQKALPDYAKPLFDKVIQKGKQTIQRVADENFDDIPKSAYEESLGIVSPKQTDTSLKEAFVEGRLQTTKKGMVENPDFITQRQAEAVQPLVESGKMSRKTPIDQQRNVIAEEVNKMDIGLKGLVRNPKYNQPFTSSELTVRLQEMKAKNRLIFKSDAQAETAYDAVIEEYGKFLKTKNVEGLLESRQAFDSYIRKNFPEAFKPDVLTGKVNPQVQALRDVRTTVNHFAADLLEKTVDPQTGKLFLDTLRKEADLMGAIESMSSKAPDAFKNANKKFLQKYPWAKNAIMTGVTGGTAVGLTGLGLKFFGGGGAE